MDVLPVFADWNDALDGVVHALGGYKRVGTMLRPEWQGRPEAASQWLRDCLNSEKRERLDPDQVLMLLRLAREAGFHAAKFWLDAEIGYQRGEPLSPQDERAQLQRQYIECVHLARDITDRMERLARSPLQAVGT
jgi:hypothetical protein